MIFNPSLSTKQNKKTWAFIKKFADAGLFFPAANVCNFMQGENSIATGIAIANLAYSVILIGSSAILKNPPDIIGDKKSSYSAIVYEFLNPLRVTAYCALVISGLLLISFIKGKEVALFPGLTAFFFGISNFIQSSVRISKFRENLSPKSFIKALTHPAVWSGLGYVTTGITIGGGLCLLISPFKNIKAFLLTLVGIVNTAGAMGLMVSGKVTNQAAPFVGVAGGAIFFAITGLVTGNFLGVATGLFACAGQLSLAVLMQKLHNITNSTAIQSASKIESFLTAPICWAMKRGWIAFTP
jgi:hypothetical protein